MHECMDNPCICMNAWIIHVYAWIKSEHVLTIFVTMKDALAEIVERIGPTLSEMQFNKKTQFNNKKLSSMKNINSAQ